MASLISAKYNLKVVVGFQEQADREIEDIKLKKGLQKRFKRNIKQWMLQ